MIDVTKLEDGDFVIVKLEVKWIASTESTHVLHTYNGDIIIHGIDVKNIIGVEKKKK